MKKNKNNVTKYFLIKRIVDIDTQLCSSSLDPEQRRSLKSKRDALEKKLYK